MQQYSQSNPALHGEKISLAGIKARNCKKEQQNYRKVLRMRTNLSYLLVSIFGLALSTLSGGKKVKSCEFFL